MRSPAAVDVEATPRLGAEYVLPLRWSAGEDPAELTDYLHRLSRWLDVTIVDGSDPEVFARHDELWASIVNHVRPEPWPGRNGKVAGVVTGLGLARHEWVVIGDDDVRWDYESLARATALLQTYDLVRPQNFFDPQPWHARWDTARSLLNRAFGADYPGTYGVRRSTFLRMGGYDGDVLFENLELSRTVRAVGGIEFCPGDLFVLRRPPTARHFCSQRVRQAYDDLAQPARLIADCALLPAVAVLVRNVLSRRGSSGTAALTALALAGVAPVLLAERGRRRGGGGEVFGRTAALWAPLWLLERAACIWLALLYRATGGMPYAGQRLKVAAHGTRQLRQSRRASVIASGCKRREDRQSRRASVIASGCKRREDRQSRRASVIAPLRMEER